MYPGFWHLGSPDQSLPYCFYESCGPRDEGGVAIGEIHGFEACGVQNRSIHQRIRRPPKLVQMCIVDFEARPGHKVPQMGLRVARHVVRQERPIEALGGVAELMHNVDAAWLWMIAREGMKVFYDAQHGRDSNSATNQEQGISWGL